MSLLKNHSIGSTKHFGPFFWKGSHLMKLPAALTTRQVASASFATNSGTILKNAVHFSRKLNMAPRMHLCATGFEI